MNTRVPNPFEGIEGYNCFACAPDNRCGLKLSFNTDSQRVWALWKPTTTYQGYGGLVHGGIQATLLDEVASWTLYVLLGVAGLTTQLEIQYLAPLSIENTVKVVGAVHTHTPRVACIHTFLEQGGQVATKGVVRYRVIPESIARRHYYFPGAESFKNK